VVAFFFQYWSNGFAGQWLDLPSRGSLYASATAMTLAAIVASQIGNLFAQRSERLSIYCMNPFTNRLLWLGVGVEVVLLLAAVPLLPLADEVRKAVVRRKTKSRGSGSLHQTKAGR
jgi:magnesium-transporting ATPase (P-type)